MRVPPFRLITIEVMKSSPKPPASLMSPSSTGVEKPSGTADARRTALGAALLE